MRVINKFKIILLTSILIPTVSFAGTLPTSGEHEVSVKTKIGNTLPPMYDVSISVDGDIEWDARNMTQVAKPNLIIENNSTTNIELKMPSVGTSGDITPDLYPSASSNIKWDKLTPEDVENYASISMLLDGNISNILANGGGFRTDAYSYKTSTQEVEAYNMNYGNNKHYPAKTTAIGILAEGKTSKMPLEFKAGKHFARDVEFDITFNFTGSLAY